MNHQRITLLDLGGVVFQSTGVSNDQIDWTIITTLNHKYGYDLNIGKNLIPEFLKEYNALTKQDLDGETFLKGVFDTLEINEELIQFLSRNGKVIIVSDNYRENIAYISKRYCFSDWSINQIYSFDYQMVKSNPLFFRRLVEELSDVPVSEMILIDDSVDKIKSAQKSGIMGIRYECNDRVFDRLRELGYR
ncbi:HAD family hydrolase [Lewinella sp. W8]|uniref:HAD family hydrolase n=1 Tax=Lewinella sp. W8 TaxID=2528208 RepID=UPI0010676060|nr:HAD family hydrolase [Lewinella sp. W8]MTB51120.1 hypothetical protein [Lewinella sp. W8]